MSLMGQNRKRPRLRRPPPKPDIITRRDQDVRLVAEGDMIAALSHALALNSPASTVKLASF